MDTNDMQQPAEQGARRRGADTTHFLIVGLGASAGGIEALQAFFAHVAVDSGMAYVVILHLSPDHDSQLAQVLQTVTSIPVTQVTERVRVEPNHVYVIPPSQHLLMVDDHIAVSPTTTLEERRAPVDLFFRTLADSHAARAVCVVLSGTGANGSMGLKRVKEHGGAVFVQDPHEAAYGEMPRNAIATNLVDEVLPVAAIPERIIAYVAALGSAAIPIEAEQRSDDQQQALREVFTQLRGRTGHDFSNYKRATLLRRIERRITVHNLPDLPAYAALLREQPNEAHALLKDLLISVTNFFRDKEAFGALESDILPRILGGKARQEPLRVWVVGCATGEEAYSIAMLLAERTLGVLDAPKVQIFATDIDEAALAHARQGRYTINDAADVSPERLRRFFTREGDGYRVTPELREMVLFATHNIIKDPPFSHLDLITCRNLLIYLDRTAQERVIETLHFALNPGGYLFLGTSETVDGASDLFAPYSREHHIFKSRPTRTHSFPVPETVPALRLEMPQMASASTAQEHAASEAISFGDLHLRLVEQYAPPSLVVNDEYEIVHLSERAGRYLHVAGGELSRNLLTLIRPELRLELRNALYQAVQRQTNVATPNLPIRIDNHVETITLQVRPVLREDEPGHGFLLVVFEPGTPAPGDTEMVNRSDTPLARHLEEEALRLRAQLRLANEQYETHAEELKAANEELQATVEELRSAAEELETSREELQSINEELRTVNQELKVKVDETTKANNNLLNLVNSTNIGTIFLDRGFRVALFTPAATELFNLIAADHGRPLSDITHRLVDVDVLADAERVLTTLQPVEREVRAADGHVFLMHVLPYRTSDDHIGGVVLTFVNISERKRAEEALRVSEEKYRALFETMDDGFGIAEIIVDAAGRPVDYRMVEINPQFERLTGLGSEVVGKLNSEYAPNTEKFWIETFDRVARNGTPERVENYHEATDRWYSVHVSKVSGEERRIAAVFEDITERKQRERQQEFLLKLSDALRPLSGAVEIQSTAMRVLGEHLQVDRVLYAEVEPDGETYIILDNYVREAYPKLIGRFPANDFGTASERLRAGETFAVEDMTSDERLSEAARAAFIEFNVYASVGVPLIKSGRWVANLGIQHGQAREWTEEEIALVQETAERTWAAVERAKAEEALRHADERYRTMTDNAPVLIWETDESGGTFANQHYTDFFGVSFEEILAMGWAKFLHPDDAEDYIAAYKEAFERREPYSYECRFRRADGEYRWLLNTGHPLGENRFVGFSADITERKRAEEALRASEEKYRTLFDSMDEGVSTLELIFDENERAVDYIFVEHNAAMTKQTRLTSDIIGKRVSEVTPNLEAYWFEAFERVVKTGLPERHEYYIADLDSWFDIYTTRVADSDSREVVCIYNNITERKRRELSTALLDEIGKDLSILSMPDEIMQTIGKRLYQFLGLSGCYFVDVDEAKNEVTVHYGWASEKSPSLMQTFNLEEYLSEDFLRTMRAGAVFVMRDTAQDERAEAQSYARLKVGSFVTVPFFRHGRYTGHIAVTTEQAHDWQPQEIQLLKEISSRIFPRIERARAEEALRESEEKYRALFENMEDGFGIAEIIVDDAGQPVDYRMLEINPQFERLTGQSREQFLNGRTVREVAPELEEEWYQFYGQVGITGQAAHREIHAAAWGRWFEVTAYRTGEPAQRRVAILYAEVTERKRAEQALRQSEARFRTLTDVVPQVIWANEAGGRAVYFNQRWYEYSGLSLEESVGPGWQAIVHPDDAPASGERWQRALAAGEVFDTEYRLRRADGVYRWFIGRNVPLRDEHGQVTSWFGSATDIEDLKQAEAAVQRARAELELRVQERTSELATANRALQQEIDERRQLEEQRAALVERIITAQEGERQRIARELHDTLGQFLSALNLRLSMAQSLEGLLPTVGDELEQLRMLAGRVDQEVDRLTMELRPPALEHLGLADALHRYAEEWTAMSGVAVDVLVGGLDTSRLPPVVETTTYRIVQEALTNVLKHAQATVASVIVQRRAGELRVIVEDDGVGFEPSQHTMQGSAGQQVGLIGMMERAALAGGEVTIESAPGAGTTIYLRIPLREDTPRNTGGGRE